MSFRLQTGEGLADAVRRAAGAELTAGAAALAEDGGPVARDEAVHEARKAVKRVRSLLRLVRSGVDRDARRDLDQRLRAAAGGLGEVRDAEVLVGTAAALRAPEDGDGDGAPDGALDGLHTALEDRRGRIVVRAAAGPAEGGAVHAATALADAGGDLARLAIDGADRDVVTAGLLRTVRRGRLWLDTPVGSADGEAFHGGRKRAKDLRYQLEFLTPLWPGPLAAQADQLHRLTDLLGDEHDLAVLAATVDAEPGLLEERHRAAVAARIATRRAARRREALALGRLVHAEGARPFVRRVGRYWDLARVD